ncbi:hypothetical protein ABLE68_00215 [Nocardioides sp. CN2-186]|uniref:hypothetical protein n=1 Tax=Nocardioides tweenelious TaxID=3156607 RepID=UPI0032B61A92
MNSRLLGLATGVVLVAGGLAGCSGSDSAGGSDGTPSTSGSASASPYLPVPDGVSLTPPGTHLEVGDSAVVAYEPRQDQVGALDITVTKLQKTSIKDSFAAWQLSDEQKKSTPYFVDVTVENVGDTDLGGRRIPLYVVNDQNVLVESTPFASSFEPCPSTPFPDKFPSGKSVDACLVYLLPDHGTLDAVSFRPDESFNPITWTGEVSKAKPPKSEKSDKPGKGKKNGKGKGKN